MQSTGRQSDQFARVVSTTLLTPPWSTAAAVMERFVGSNVLLPRIFGMPMVWHTLSPRVAAPASLQSLVARLCGRMSVVNPARALRLPRGLAAASIGLVRGGFDCAMIATSDSLDPAGLNPRAHTRSSTPYVTHSRAVFERRMARELVSALAPATRDALTGDATWAALALYEQEAPVVAVRPGRQTSTPGELPNAAAVAHLAYRLVIASGDGRPSDWHAIDAGAGAAPAVSWPIQRRFRVGEAGHVPPVAWFTTPLLVPDAWFCAHADAETLSEWARLTGRAGVADRYWYPETWDRFLEPGRRVGWLSVNDVWRPRRGALPLASTAQADSDAWSDDDVFSRSPWTALTPNLERGVVVPPGYALVECVGTISVAVVVLRG